MRCAVNKCKQSNSTKSTNGKSVPFYSFPKDPDQRKLWIMFCNQRNTVNGKNLRICGLHFQEDDFERNLKFEMGFSNRRAPKLKPGAVPTIEAVAIANKIDTLTTCDEKSNPMTTDNVDSLQLYIKTLQMNIDTLRQENNMLKMSQRRSAITIKNLSSQVQSLNFKNASLEKSLRRLFSEGQIKKLKNGDKRQNFSEADIAQALTLYSTSAKAYMLLKNKNFPLPSVRTLQRWSHKSNVSIILEPVEQVVPANYQMSETQELNVLSFDEIKDETKVCYDKSVDPMLSPTNNIQIALLRGTSSSPLISSPPTSCFPSDSASKSGNFNDDDIIYQESCPSLDTSAIKTEPDFNISDDNFNEVVIKEEDVCEFY